jgi:hypothetical protein
MGLTRFGVGQPFLFLLVAGYFLFLMGITKGNFFFDLGLANRCHLLSEGSFFMLGHLYSLRRFCCNKLWQANSTEASEYVWIPVRCK